MARRTVSFGGVSPQRRDRGVPSAQPSSYQSPYADEQSHSRSRKSSGRVSPPSLQPTLSRRSTASTWRPSPSISRTNSQKRSSRPRMPTSDSYRSSKRDTVSSMSTFYFDSDADDTDNSMNAVRPKNKATVSPPRRSTNRLPPHFSAEQTPGIHSRANSTSKVSTRETVQDILTPPKSMERTSSRSSSHRPKMPNKPITSSQSLPPRMSSARTTGRRAGDHEIRQWSTQQVAAWLQRTGFEDRVISSFEDNEVNGAKLLDMHVHDLKELGIQSFGKRHQIWNELRRLRVEHGMDPTVGDDSEVEAPIDPALFSPISECASPLEGQGQGERHRQRQSDGYTNAWPQMRKIIPRPHRCYKGEQCKKFRKLQRMLEQVDRVHNFNENPTRKTPPVTELRIPDDKAVRAQERISQQSVKLPTRTDSAVFRNTTQSEVSVAEPATAAVAMASAPAIAESASNTPPGSPSLKARRFLDSIPKPAKQAPQVSKGILRVEPNKTVHPPRGSSLSKLPAKSKKNDSLEPVVTPIGTAVSEMPPSPFIIEATPKYPDEVHPSERKPLIDDKKGLAAASPSAISFQPQDHLINAATSSSDSDAAGSSGRRFSRRSFNLRNARHFGQRRHFETMPTLAETNSVYKPDEVISTAAPAPPVPTGPGSATSMSSPRQINPPTSPKQAQSPTKKPYRASASQLTVPATPTLRHAALPYPSLKLNTLTAVSTNSVNHFEPTRASPSPAAPTSAESATTVSVAPTSAVSALPAAAISAPSIVAVSESPVSAISATPFYTLPSTPAPHQTFPGFAREGWVRKRRNKLWRHEWNDSYLRLQGSSLIVSSSASPNAGALEIIDVGEYDVQPCPPNTTGKIASAMKSLRKNSRSSIGGLSTASSTVSGGGDSAASDVPEEEMFAWQLIPSGLSQAMNAQATPTTAPATRDEDVPAPDPFRSMSVPNVSYVAAMAPTTPTPTPTSIGQMSPPLARTTSAKTVNVPGHATTPTTNASTAFTDRSSIIMNSGGRELKIHQFAVLTRDERIEWMREFMLAKALSLKKKASASGLSLPGAGALTPSGNASGKHMGSAGVSEPDLANQLVSGSTTGSNSAGASASTSASVSLALSSNVSGDTSRKDSGSSEETSSSAAPGTAVSTESDQQSSQDPTTPTAATVKSGTSIHPALQNRGTDGYLTPSTNSGRATPTLTPINTSKGRPPVLMSGSGSFVLSASSSSSLIVPQKSVTPASTAASTTAAAAAAAAAAMRNSAAVANRAA